MSRLPAWAIIVGGVTYGAGRPILQSGQPLLHARVWTPEAYKRRGREVFDPSDRVTGFQYDTEEGKQDKVTIIVDNQDLAYFESPILQKGTDFTFSYGYAGQLAPGGEAKVQGVRGMEELRVEAYGLALSLTTHQRTLKWELFTRSRIVEQIAFDHHIPKTRITPSVTVETISQVGVTDWQFLLELAEPLGYSVYFTIEQGVRVLNFRYRDHSEAPVRIFEWQQPGRVFEAGSPRGLGVRLNNARSAPLLGFSIDDSKNKGKASEVKATGYDPDSRRPIRETGRRATAPQVGKLGPVTEVATPEESGGRNEEAVRIEPTAHASNEMVRQEANTRYQLAQEGQILATAIVEGDPTITTGQIIEIAGVPQFLAGNYYIRAAKHTIGGDGYRTSMKLSRNAVGIVSAAPRPPMPPAPGPPNRRSARNADPNALSTRTGVDRDGNPMTIFQARGP